MDSGHQLLSDWHYCLKYVFRWENDFLLIVFDIEAFSALGGKCMSLIVYGSHTQGIKSIDLSSVLCENKEWNQLTIFQKDK